MPVIAADGLRGILDCHAPVHRHHAQSAPGLSLGAGTLPQQFQHGMHNDRPLTDPVFQTADVICLAAGCLIGMGGDQKGAIGTGRADRF